MSERIITKQCFACKQAKPLSGFHKHPGHKDGYRNRCKLCMKAYKHRRYIAVIKPIRQTVEGRENGRKVGRRYRIKHPLREKKSLEKYRQTEKYREKQRRYMNSEQYPARTAVCNAVRDGKMKAAKNFQCHYCPNQASQYHHHKGYAPEHWLDVIPVCVPCHGKTQRIA